MPKDQDAAVVVETDPDGRYHRYKEKLGEGSFKSVYKAFDSENGIEVAWNQVKIKGRLLGDAKERFMEEVILLQKLRHRSIIECYHYWEDEEKEHVNFITELMTSGTLKSFVKTKKVNLRIIRKWARQILSALDYLHTDFDKPIIHRDLKCDNIFINGNLGEVKLGDLGLSTMLTETHAQSVIGTPEFMAPELYEEQYTEKVDIYAFGMCILEIFTNEYPYSECSNAAQIYKKVTKGLPPSSLDKMENIAVKHFIEQCLMSEADRPSAKTLLQHDLLMDVEGGPAPAPAALAAPEDKKEPSQTAAAGETAARPVEDGKAAAGGMGPEILGAEMRASDEADAGPETGKISIQAKINGKNKMIEFDFDTSKDSVTEVATDLLESIDADATVLPHFENVIQNAVNNFRAQQQSDAMSVQNESTRPAEAHAAEGISNPLPSTSPSSEGGVGGATPAVSPPPSSGGGPLPVLEALDGQGASVGRANPMAGEGGAQPRKEGPPTPTVAPQQTQPPQPLPQTQTQPAAPQAEGDAGGAGAYANGAAGRGGEGAGAGPRGSVSGGVGSLGDGLELSAGLQEHAGGEGQGASAQQRAPIDGGGAGKVVKEGPGAGVGAGAGAGAEGKAPGEGGVQAASGGSVGVGAGNPRPAPSVSSSAGEHPPEGGSKGATGRGGSVAGNPTPPGPGVGGGAGVAGVGQAPAPAVAGSAGGGAPSRPAGEMKATKMTYPVTPWGNASVLEVPEGAKPEVDKKVKELEQVYVKQVKAEQEAFLAAVRQLAEDAGGRVTTVPSQTASSQAAAAAGGGAANAAQRAQAGADDKGAERKPSSPIPSAAKSTSASLGKPASPGPALAVREPPPAMRNPAAQAPPASGGAPEGQGA